MLKRAWYINRNHVFINVTGTLIVQHTPLFAYEIALTDKRRQSGIHLKAFVYLGKDGFWP